MGRGEASATVVYPYGAYPGFNDYLDFRTGVASTEGTYAARVECRAGAYDANSETGDVLGVMDFAQTVTGSPGRNRW